MQLYQFLKAFHEHRYKVPYRIDDHRWHMWFHNLPDHQSIRVIDSEALDLASQQESEEYTMDGPEPGTSRDDDTHAHAGDFLLRIRRPDLTDAPAPPEEILSWLGPGWADLDSEPSYKPERQDVLGAGPRPITFDEDPERLRQWDEWIERHRRWVETEKPARRAMDTYERLYALYSQLERESESVELVLGDGLLVWQMSESEFGLFQQTAQVAGVALHKSRIHLIDPSWPAILWIALCSAVVICSQHVASLLCPSTRPEEESDQLEAPLLRNHRGARGSRSCLQHTPVLQHPQ